MSLIVAHLWLYSAMQRVFLLASRDALMGFSSHTCCISARTVGRTGLAVRMTCGYYTSCKCSVRCGQHSNCVITSYHLAQHTQDVFPKATPYIWTHGKSTEPMKDVETPKKTHKGGAHTITLNWLSWRLHVRSRTNTFKVCYVHQKG